MLFYVKSGEGGGGDNKKKKYHNVVFDRPDEPLSRYTRKRQLRR